MEKILNYIKNGRGIGLKYILVLSLVVIAFVLFYLKIFGEEPFVDTAQEISDQFLPIRIENGKIVEPANTVKTYSVNLGKNRNGSKQSLNFILNTKIDNINIRTQKEGFYFTREAVYIIGARQTKVIPYGGDLDLPKGDYTKELKNVFTQGLYIFSIFGLIGVFLYYTILVIFYAFCSYAVSAFLNKNFNFDLRMRLSSLTFTTSYVLFTLLGAFGFGSRLIFFLAIIALQALILREIPSQEINEAK